MAFWRRPMVSIVYRSTMKSHDRRWLLRRSVYWICTASEKCIDQKVAGHNVIEGLGAGVKGLFAGAARKICDEAHGDAGQGPAGREEVEAEALMDVFTTGRWSLRSNLFWTSTNWLISQLNRIQLWQGPTWLRISSEAIAQISLPNNGIAVHRYHGNHGDISVIFVEIPKCCNMILIFYITIKLFWRVNFIFISFLSFIIYPNSFIDTYSFIDTLKKESNFICKKFCIVNYINNVLLTICLYWCFDCYIKYIKIKIKL